MDGIDMPPPPLSLHQRFLCSEATQLSMYTLPMHAHACMAATSREVYEGKARANPGKALAQAACTKDVFASDVVSGDENHHQQTKHGGREVQCVSPQRNTCSVLGTSLEIMDQRSPLSCVVFDSSAVMEGMNGRRLMRAFEKHTYIWRS